MLILQTKLEDWTKAPNVTKPIVKRSKILNESLALRSDSTASKRVDGYWRRMELRERRERIERPIYRKTTGRTSPPLSRTRITHMYHTYVCVKPRITHG